MDQPIFTEFVEVMDRYAFQHHDAVRFTGINSKDLLNAATRGLLGEAYTQVGKGGRREYTGRQLIEIALVDQFLRLKIPIGEAIKLSVGTLTDYYVRELQALADAPTLERVRKYCREITQIHSDGSGALYETIINPDHTTVDSLRGETARIIVPAGMIIMKMANCFGDEQRAKRADA